MKLIQHQIQEEDWTLTFQDHKSLRFKSKEDLEKYLRGECSETYGIMEYEKVPDYVEHTIYYDIDWDGM